MVKDDLMVALLREYPNGVSFDPLAMRLLRQKVPFEDEQVENLKTELFQLGNGLWFSREMISDVETQLAFRKQANEWLVKYGCFSVERLFEGFCGVLRHIITPEACASFLRHLGFTVAVWGKCGLVCFQPPSSLDESLATTSKLIAEWLNDENGTLTVEEIAVEIPYLTAKALEGIRARFLPEVHVVEIGGMPCWRKAEEIPLPEDFSERLTTVVDTLVALYEKVTVAKLEFALNLVYRIRFREEYGLLDNGTFMRICAKHYQGRNKVFPDVQKAFVKVNDSSVSGRRVRGQNTRFRSLGVPIGAELVFIRGDKITCTVLDDSNQVKYDGKLWTISALANHLLNTSSENGFRHFSYENEILWERRLRLERESKWNGHQAEEPPPAEVWEEENTIISLDAHTLSAGSEVGSSTNCRDDVKSENICSSTNEQAAVQNDSQGGGMSPPAGVREAEGEIIGLQGRTLSPRNWRAIKSAGTNPLVAKWIQRIANGESIEQISFELGCADSTLKLLISNYHLYFRVCKLNGIVPEGGMNV